LLKKQIGEGQVLRFRARGRAIHAGVSDDADGAVWVRTPWMLSGFPTWNRRDSIRI